MHLHGAHSAVPTRRDLAATADPTAWAGTGAVPQTNLRGRLCPSYADGTLTGRAALLLQYQPEENDMGRGLLLWLIGIPLPIILIVWLLGGLHG
jgi:hypothetical protein